MASDRVFFCKLLSKDIPEGLCVEILLAPEMVGEVKQFTPDQIYDSCGDCQYSAD